LFDTSGMIDSVAGTDIRTTLLPSSDRAVIADVERYDSVLTRLAVPYVVDLANRKMSVGQYTASTLTPISGAISTVQDLEKFDLSLKNGILLKPETIAMAQVAPTAAFGQKLPHAIGWFAQNYLGENVYWQFGTSDTGGSGLIVVWPTRS